MYSMVLMAAVGGGPAVPADHHGAAVVVAGCNGCTGVVVGGCCGWMTSCHGCSGYASCYGSCRGSCHGGGFLGLRNRGGCHGGGLFGHHNKTSCHGCSGSSCHGCYGWAYGSCTGYAGSCYGSCHGFVGHGYGSCHGCGGCTGYGGAYPSYHHPYPSDSYPAGITPGTIVIPAETPKATDATKDAKDTKDAGKGKSAGLNFRLPAGATLYVDGRKTDGTGTERSFFTPPLEAGQKYYYEVKAELSVGGQTVTDEKRVVVEAGVDQVVEFTRLMAAAGTGEAVAGK